MIIICIMGKSGTGKSTVIEALCKQNNIYHSVKSYTTRPIRDYDPNDINTHTFVNDAYWENNKDKALAVYHNKEKDYYSWTDENSFKEDKINLYAIDPKAYLELLKNPKMQNHHLFGIYLYIDEEVRMERLCGRGDEYSEEYHLDYDILNDTNKKIIFNITKHSKEQTQITMKGLIDLWRELSYYKIIHAIKCKKCGEIIYSTSRHDFKWCSCHTVAIDGGYDYCRVVGNTEDFESYEMVKRKI